MVTFKNNNSNRRNNFRRSDRTYKSNSDRVKINNGFSNNENFQRKPVHRNINNVSKLIEKYSNLAREALSSGDKILSENYFQHADHFTRLLEEQENLKKARIDSKINNGNKIDTIEKKTNSDLDKIKNQSDEKEVLNS